MVSWEYVGMFFVLGVGAGMLIMAIIEVNQ